MAINLTRGCQLQAKRQTMEIRCRFAGSSTFITDKSSRSDEKNVRSTAAGNILWLADDALKGHFLCGGLT